MGPSRGKNEGVNTAWYQHAVSLFVNDVERSPTLSYRVSPQQKRKESEGFFWFDTPSPPIIRIVHFLLIFLGTMNNYKN